MPVCIEYVHDAMKTGYIIVQIAWYKNDYSRILKFSVHLNLCVEEMRGKRETRDERRSSGIGNADVDDERWFADIFTLTGNEESKSAHDLWI